MKYRKQQKVSGPGSCTDYHICLADSIIEAMPDSFSYHFDGQEEGKADRNGSNGKTYAQLSVSERCECQFKKLQPGLTC